MRGGGGVGLGGVGGEYRFELGVGFVGQDYGGGEGVGACRGCGSRSSGRLRFGAERT